MKTKLKGLLVLIVFTLGQAAQIHAADANPPERMTYQGYLVDGNGDPLGNSAPANYDVIFRIYNLKEGGNPENILWTEQQTVTVDKGYFSVLLGEGSSVGSEPNGNLSSAFVGSDSSDRFVGITVKGLGGGDVEITPRLRMVASPFTFLAAYARQADRIVGVGGDVLTTDGGNIGIGNASPTSKLDVGGDIRASGNANVQGQLAVGKSSAPTAALDVAGTVKSSAGLDISGNSAIGGTLALTPTGVNRALEINPASGTSYKLSLWSDNSASYIRNDSSLQDLRLGANNLDTLTIKPGGNVGIGNIDPGQKLDVGGAINATGNVTRNGQPLVRVDVLADRQSPITSNTNHGGGKAVRANAFTVMGDPVMLFISGSFFSHGQINILGKLRVDIYSDVSPWESVYNFEIKHWHATIYAHRAFAPINMKIPNNVITKGNRYFVQIRESNNAYMDYNDFFTIIVTQYNNQ